MLLPSGVPSTVEAAAAVCTGVALLSVLVVLSSVRRLPGYARQSYVWLAAGVASSAIALVGAAVAAARHESPMVVVLVLASLGVLATVPMVTGLLGLLGPPPAAGARLRHGLDGAIVGACFFFIGWLVYVYPDGTPDLGLTFNFLVLAGPAWVVSSVLGIALMTAARAVRPRRATWLASAGAGVTGVGVLAGSIGYLHPSPANAAWIAGPTVAGHLLIGLAAVLSRGTVGPGAEPPVAARTMRSGWAFASVSAVVVCCIVQVVTVNKLIPVSVLTGCFIVLALVGRFALALRDLRGSLEAVVQSEAVFKTMAFTDPLTGLGNRRRLRDHDLSGPACSLITIDLDGFKNVNDLQGHDVGDAVLVEVGRRLRVNVRPGDVPVRLGGDEFAVLTIAYADSAVHVAERLLAVLRRPYELDAGSVFLSASMGLAGSGTANDVEGLLRNADLALRFAKSRGKNRVEQYEETYDTWLRQRIAVEQGLRRAIEREELSLSYQPVVRLPDGVPVGVEALLRWQHPELGHIPPADFIPIAEEVGQISALGRWTLHRACRQLSRWLGDGLDLWLAVNVSVRELRGSQYSEHVAEVLRAHRVPPDRLVLEVTEHSIATDIDELIAPLRELRELGVRIALDDFGAGYSSLGQLHKLPVDVLKIDRDLVAEPTEGPDGVVGPLVDIVVMLGRRLNLQVIAEGVEEPAQRAAVEVAGCQLGQGYLFARAMPAEHVEALLTAGSAGHGLPSPRAASP